MNQLTQRSKCLSWLIAHLVFLVVQSQAGNEGRGGGTLEAAAWKKETLQMISALEPYQSLLPRWFDARDFRTKIEQTRVFAVGTLPSRFVSKDLTDQRFGGIALDASTRSIFFVTHPEQPGIGTISRIYWILRLSENPQNAFAKVAELAPYTVPLSNASGHIDLTPEAFNDYSGGLRNFYRESYLDYASRMARSLRNIPANQVPQWFDAACFEDTVSKARVEVVDRLTLPADIDSAVAERLQGFSDRSKMLTQIKLSFFEQRNRFEMGRLLLHEYFVLCGFESDGDYTKSEIFSEIQFGDVWNQPSYRWERSWEKPNVADSLCRRFQSDIERAALQRIAKDQALNEEFNKGRISIERRLDHRYSESTLVPYLSTTFPTYCQTQIVSNTMRYRVFQRLVSAERLPGQTCTEALRTPELLPPDLDRSEMIYVAPLGTYLIGKHPYCQGKATWIVPTDSEFYRSAILRK